MKKAALYVRVSTQEQALEGYSVKEQTERLRSYCSAKDWPIVRIYTDPGYSGGNTDRPALQRLIRDIRSFDVVVVYKLDRLSRSQKDTMHIIEDVFLKNGVSFVSMCENFDTGTPLGMAMIGILSVFAQLERSQIQERMKMGKEGRVRSGKWHGGSTQPIGYDYDPSDEMLHVNEFEAMQIRELYSLYLGGTPLRTIERIFLEKGYHHKHGLWDPKQMRRTMKNATNIGMVRYLGDLYPGLHEPIIDKETFDRACRLLDQSLERWKASKARFSHSYLGGIIWCKTCGGRYHYCTGRLVKSTGLKPEYYSCYSRDHSVQKMIVDPDCRNRTIRMEELDQVVFDEIRKLALDPAAFRDLSGQDAPAESSAEKIRILKKEIDKVDSMIGRLMDLYVMDKISIDLIDQKIGPLQDQKDALLGQIEELESEEDDSRLEEIYQAILSFQDVLDRGDANEIRLVIHTLIRRIDIGPDDITITWNFE